MKKKVLIAPLDWGLGHATRCIPIINQFLKKDCEVVIGSSGAASSLLKKEFPSLRFVSLPAYAIHYSSRRSFAFSMLRQLPRILRTINKERKLISELVEREHFDLIISDNRYGCYSQKVKSIFITHQTTLLLPSSLSFLRNWVNGIHTKWIMRFQECWVPDFPDNRITEALSTNSKLSLQYIGMLSRFKKSEKQVARQFDLAVLLSGPEPQRSIFESKVKEELTAFEGKVLIVRGIPGTDGHVSTTKNITEVDHLPASELLHLMEASDIVLARSGYSTIMDLYYLGKKAILIPTPGQTEQEYLAFQLMRLKIAYSCSQDEFDLQEAIRSGKEYTGFQSNNPSQELLENCVNKLIDRL